MHDLSPQLPEPHAIIELHDSTVEALTVVPPDLIIQLDAYVHRSHGIPATDPGTGWSQRAIICVRNGQPDGPIPALPCWLSDGEIRLDADVFDNLIPPSLSCEQSTTISLVFTSGDRLRIAGDGLTIGLVGEPRFVEEVP